MATSAIDPKTVDHHDLHPAVVEILRFFQSDHLPEPLRDIAHPCCNLAFRMARHLQGPELTVGLRKLLEAKDCFVRAALPRETSFEHSGPCEDVEHPQGFAPHDE